MVAWFFILWADLHVSHRGFGAVKKVNRGLGNFGLIQRGKMAQQFFRVRYIY